MGCGLWAVDCMWVGWVPFVEMLVRYAWRLQGRATVSLEAGGKKLID